MKKICSLIFLFSIILTGNVYADAANYNVCATNDAGAILVKEEASDHTSFALASSPTSFTLTMEDDVNRGGFCEVTPDNYKIKMFKMGLCKENPWTGFDDNSSNTRSADLSSCIDVFVNPDGKEVNLQPGTEVNLLDDTVVLPVGTFPFIYALLDNVIQVKHIQEYAAHPDGKQDFVIQGYDSNGSSAGDGQVCYSGLDSSGEEFVNTFSNERQFGSVTTLREYDLPEKYTGTRKTAKFHCGTKAEADAENDWFITILNSLGDDELTSGNTTGSDAGKPTSRDATNFRNATSQDRGFHNDFPTIAQYYYLFNENDTIATSPETVEKILFIQSDTSNIVKISENTTAFKINFKTNDAIEIGVFEENTTDRVLQGTEMNANTIFINIQTKTRRSRGAWN
jgi:hypothetical protein